MKSLPILFVAFLTLLVVGCGDDEPSRLKPEAVDLGLSVKWASFNIGASETKYPGALYGWGDSLGNHKTLDDKYPVQVSFSMLAGKEITKVVWNSPYFGGKTPMENISGTDYDIAKYMWSKGWRLPTSAEMRELIDKCSWELVSLEGATGRVYRVTGPSGKSILLPLGGIRTTDAAEQRGTMGYYWTSELLPRNQQGPYGYQSDVACAAWAMTLDPKSSPKMEPQIRSYGLSVRPVTD